MYFHIELTLPQQMHNSIHGLIRQAGVRFCTPDTCEAIAEFLKKFIKSVVKVAFENKEGMYSCAVATRGKNWANTLPI